MSNVAIQLENTLTLDAPRDRVWRLITDVPQVVPCIPGGRLVEAIDESTFKAEVALDLGFTRVVFLADVLRRELEPDEGRAVLEINAVDSKGKSTAHATMTSLLSDGDGGTEVTVVTAVNMEGEVARFGPGIIEDVSYEIVEQMTRCVQARLADLESGATGPPATAGKLSLWMAVRLWIRGRIRRRRR
jgi:carbon monoxide dehydrogenase subunit G